jgi:hypothetical protein
LNEPTPLDAATLVRRRRAIMHALQRTLPREQALEAVALWNREYRHGRSAFDGLNMFARRVCARFDRIGAHIELLQRLTQAFYLDEDDLPADPGPLTHAPALEPGDAAPASVPRARAPAGDLAATPSSSRAKPTAEVATWLALVRGFARALAAHDPPAAAAMPRAILGGATQRGVDADARELIRLALEDRYGMRLDRVGREELHALLNAAYVHAANAVGPVLADRLLSATVAAVEGTPEGTAFPPRRLL